MSILILDLGREKDKNIYNKKIICDKNKRLKRRILKEGVQRTNDVVIE